MSKVQINDIYSFPCPLMESLQHRRPLDQAGPALGEVMLAVSSHLPVLNVP